MQMTNYHNKYHQTEYLICYPQVIDVINYRAQHDGTIILPKKWVKTEHGKQLKAQRMTHLDYLVCKLIQLFGGEFRGGAEGCRMLAEKLGSTSETMRKQLQRLQKIQLNSYERIPLLEKIETHKSKELAERHGYQPQACKYRLSTWFLQEEARHEAQYKVYLSGKSSYSAVKCVQYIPQIAKELQLTIKEYFLIFMHKVRYRDGRGCFNKSDWARATGVCRGTIYKALNKLKSKNLIGDFVLDRKGSHRENAQFWIQLTTLFQEKVATFFSQKKEQKPIERKEITSKPSKIAKETPFQFEDLMNLDKPLPNLAFYSEDSTRLALLEKWSEGLRQYFNYDALIWTHESRLFAGKLQVLHELSLSKLQLLDIEKTLNKVLAETQVQTPPDSIRFMSQFRINLQKTLEKYQE